MSNLTRRAIPALLASLAVSASTSLRADPAPDPVFAAIEAVTRAQAEMERAYAHHGALEEAFHSVAMYQPKVLVGHYTTQDGPDRWTVHPIHAGSEAELRSWTHGPDREQRIVNYLEKLDADRLRNLDEQKALGLTDAEAEANDASDRLAIVQAAVLTTIPTTRAGAVALAACAASFMEECRADEGGITAMRTLGAFLAKAA